VQTGLLLLDSQLRISKINPAFSKMFSVDASLPEGSKIQDIPHSFWKDDEIRNDVRNALVNGKRINKEYLSGHEPNNFPEVTITSRFILGEDAWDRSLLLVVKFV
jgi:PAS domain-containing protein